MPPRCTCGAVLPQDARFCHKCGKPQFEEDLARLKAEEEPPNSIASATPSEPARSPVSFSNSRALWISLAMAGAAFFLFCTVGAIAPPLIPLVCCAAGFVAAQVYNRNAAEPLSVRSGARLGWMTGFWVFLLFFLIAALMSVSFADPAMREQLKTVPNVARVPQFVKLLDDPHQLLMNLVVTLVVFFFMATILSGLGGMLGAKLHSRR